MKYFDRTPWPWQERGFNDIATVVDNGGPSRVVMTGPTGSGKSASMYAQIRRAIDQSKTVTLLTNRVLLAEQLYQGLCDANIGAGMVGAEFKDYADPSAPVQLCMTPTIGRRILAKRDAAVKDGMNPLKAMDKHPMPDGDVCIIDEPHMNAGAVSGRIVSEYASRGAPTLGYTATPIGIDHLFDRLIVAGTTNECRKHGALVPAVVYGCPEYDCRTYKGEGGGGEFSAKQRKAMWSPAVFSYIYKEWQRTNPDGRMSLGFGPDVPGSMWLAEHFTTPQRWIDEQNEIARRQRAAEWQVEACKEWYKNGVRAAHIDGMDCWLDGKQYKADRSARKDIIDQWRDGKIKIVWNRWVLREGIDVPELYHLILAAPFGSLQTYLQIVGRVIRYSKETPDGVVINDHGANAWRHGSPNEDRDWENMWQAKPASISNMRVDEYKRGREEPIICPKCRMTRRPGPNSHKCPKCGHEHFRSSRLVIQQNGVLKEMHGGSVQPQRTLNKTNTQKLWDQMYWAAKKAHTKLEKEIVDIRARVDAGDKLAAATHDAKMGQLEKKLGRAQTFSQLYGLFFIRNGYWPPRDLNNMPREDHNWYLRVRNVESNDLHRGRPNASE